ncbi:helix-turn-helix domain-containing protein [Bacillus pseudomycoides]|uniref:helix-turn-helix domain-containing protein n=1 Tax=Bacillus pseudomycoides TaxID=64104 RepID=UPI000BEDB004|nr:helix-turn-helix transcriptional regulator [Bacillus pseudomycoides]PED05781.1 transcriptional regulator [Bacillus pseudomycoides]PEI87147.1 transcriptional regulator [Bacillus pseudomycoides]PEK15763.1 transcriptional regulator [Bacillus pseudomycoides]PEM70266.1 transcriptional regulator [Bacillus pseudomycoides]PEO11748.1 transcriptional regulator [Bacillus pseudomycoides]
MEIKLNSRIGDWIEKSGYRKGFIAKKLEVSVKQLNNYITSTSFPNAHRLFLLANLFGCKVDDLYEVQKENPAG